MMEIKNIEMQAQCNKKAEPNCKPYALPKWLAFLPAQGRLVGGATQRSEIGVYTLVLQASDGYVTVQTEF